MVAMCELESSACRRWGSGFSGFRGFGVLGLGFRVLDLGFRVLDLGLQDYFWGWPEAATKNERNRVSANVRPYPNRTRTLNRILAKVCFVVRISIYWMATDIAIVP